MESGSIVEYIDRQKIMCAVVLEVKNQRLRLLTENNREVNLSQRRLLHKDKTCLDSTLSRDQMVDALKEIVHKRQELIKNIDIKELWEVLNSEQTWIDLATMTEFCFPQSPSGDHESAVIRALFNDRLYFRFNPDGFFPNSERRVEQITAQRKAEERKKRLIETGSLWLKSILNSAESADLQMRSDEIQQLIDILKSYYLFQKDSKENEIVVAPQALEKVNLTGKIISADALHTQRCFSAQIVDGGGDYILPVKENQPRLYQDIQQLFAPEHPKPGFGKINTDFTKATQVSKGHGRLEIRTITTSEMLNAHVSWPGLEQVYRLERQFNWLRDGTCYKQTCEIEYGITSLTRLEAPPLQVLQKRRDHWYIETGLHYRRDVTFREDSTRMTIGDMGSVMAAINNLTLALIRQAGFHNTAQGRRWFAGHLDRAFQLLTTSNPQL